MEEENLASSQYIDKLVELEKSLFYDFDPMEMGEDAAKACELLKLRVGKARKEVHKCLEQLQKTTLVSVMSNNDLLLEKMEAYPVYLKKGETLHWNIKMQQPAQIRLYNVNSRSRLKNYVNVKSVSDSLAIENSAIYLVEIVPQGIQYASVDIGYRPLDIERLSNPPTEILQEEVTCAQSDFRAFSCKGINMVKIFEEPRKCTLRGQLKATFSGKGQQVSIAMPIPAGTVDVLYSLRISTSESDKYSDGKFFDGMASSYRRIRFLGLPIYESARNRGLINTLLDDNRPVRDEDAYCNMYLFRNAAEAKRFQDNVSTTGPKRYNYDIDYSQMGTQSCCGRIPVRGARSLYFGFENERVRYSNYIWLEAVASVPTTEYHTTKYTVAQ